MCIFNYCLTRHSLLVNGDVGSVCSVAHNKVRLVVISQLCKNQTTVSLFVFGKAVNACLCAGALNGAVFFDFKLKLCGDDLIGLTGLRRCLAFSGCLFHKHIIACFKHKGSSGAVNCSCLVIIYLNSVRNIRGIGINGNCCSCNSLLTCDISLAHMNRVSNRSASLCIAYSNSIVCLGIFNSTVILGDVLWFFYNLTTCYHKVGFRCYNLIFLSVSLGSKFVSGFTECVITVAEFDILSCAGGSPCDSYGLTAFDNSFNALLLIELNHIIPVALRSLSVDYLNSCALDLFIICDRSFGDNEICRNRRLVIAYVVIWEVPLTAVLLEIACCSHPTGCGSIHYGFRIRVLNYKQSCGSSNLNVSCLVEIENNITHYIFVHPIVEIRIPFLTFTCMTSVKTIVIPRFRSNVPNTVNKSSDVELIDLNLVCIFEVEHYVLSFGKAHVQNRQLTLIIEHAVSVNINSCILRVMSGVNRI